MTRRLFASSPMSIGTPNGPYDRALRISDFYTKQNRQWDSEWQRHALHQESVEEQLAAPRPVGDQMKRICSLRIKQCGGPKAQAEIHR